MLVETAEAMLEIILVALAVVLALAMMFLVAAMVLAANRPGPPTAVAASRPQPQMPVERCPPRGPVSRPSGAAARVEGERSCSASF